MTLREKAIVILQIVGEPIEANHYTDDLIRKIIRVMDRRSK